MISAMCNEDHATLGNNDFLSGSFTTIGLPIPAASNQKNPLHLQIRRIHSTWRERGKLENMGHIIKNFEIFSTSLKCNSLPRNNGKKWILSFCKLTENKRINSHYKSDWKLTNILNAIMAMQDNENQPLDW